MSTTYDRIDEELKKRHWSRRKLAQLSEINQSTMSALFARRPNPFPEKYLAKIAETLEMPPHELRGVKIVKIPSIELINTPQRPFRSEPIAKAIAERATKDILEEALSKTTFGKLMVVFSSMNDLGQSVALKVLESLASEPEFQKQNGGD